MKFVLFLFRMHVFPNGTSAGGPGPGTSSSSSSKGARIQSLVNAMEGGDAMLCNIYVPQKGLWTPHSLFSDVRK